MEGFRLNRKRTRKIQTAIKLAILVLVTYFAVVHQLRGILVAPPIHAFCPFGGLESLFKLIISGTFIKKIFPATMVLFVTTLFMALVLRRGFCGWICPLGLLQEFFTRLGRKFKVQQNRIPEKADRILKYVKYAGLVLIIFFTWKTGELVFAPYDPWTAYGHIVKPSLLIEEYFIGLIFLVVGLVGSIWITQNWCKYFCPMGALLAPISLLSPTKIIRSEAECINCNKCTKICPVSIKVSEVINASTAECYQCGDCLSVCPVPGALEYKTVKKKHISWLTYGVIAIVLFFGSVYASKASKIWKSGYSSVESILHDKSGKLNPSYIRGSLTFGDVEKSFHVPPAFLKEKLSILKDVPNDKMFKELMWLYNFRMQQLRDIVADYVKQNNPDSNLKKPRKREDR